MGTASVDDQLDYSDTSSSQKYKPLGRDVYDSEGAHTHTHTHTYANTYTWTNKLLMSGTVVGEPIEARGYWNGGRRGEKEFYLCSFVRVCTCIYYSHVSMYIGSLSPQQLCAGHIQEKLWHQNRVCQAEDGRGTCVEVYV